MSWSKDARISFLEKEVQQLRYRVLELESAVFCPAPGVSYQDRNHRNSISLRQAVRALAQHIGVEIRVVQGGDAEAVLIPLSKEQQ